jgi:hypothetical protein
MVMGILVFSLLFASIILLIAFIVHIDYELNNTPDHPQTEAEANIDMLKIRISQMNRKVRG